MIGSKEIIENEQLGKGWNDSDELFYPQDEEWPSVEELAEDARF